MTGYNSTLSKIVAIMFKLTCAHASFLSRKLRLLCLKQCKLPDFMEISGIKMSKRYLLAFVS